MDVKKPQDQKQAELVEFQLEPVPQAVNDDRYDGGFHVSPRGRSPNPGDRPVSKRSAAQWFTFD